MTNCRGFEIRTFKTGVISHFVKFNVGAKQRRKTLGKVVEATSKTCASWRPTSWPMLTSALTWWP